jgi:hypothetical protein
MTPVKNLVITAVLDEPGSRSWRTTGKLWVASLLRHQWGGRIIICRNSNFPLFAVQRADLVERPPIKTIDPKIRGRHQLSATSRELILETAARLEEPENYQWVLFADADCISLRNLDHLFVDGCDLLVSRERGIPDPGFLAVRGSRLKEWITQLSQAGGLTVTAILKAIETGSWRVKEFERGEVMRPNDDAKSLSDLASAAVIHFSKTSPELKRKLSFAFHMMAVYGDEDGLFFDMMDA